MDSDNSYLRFENTKGIKDKSMEEEVYLHYEFYPLN